MKIGWESGPKSNTVGQTWHPTCFHAWRLVSLRTVNCKDCSSTACRMLIFGFSCSYFGECTDSTATWNVEQRVISRENPSDSHQQTNTVYRSSLVSASCATSEYRRTSRSRWREFSLAKNLSPLDLTWLAQVAELKNTNGCMSRPRSSYRESSRRDLVCTVWKRLHRDVDELCSDTHSSILLISWDYWRCPKVDRTLNPEMHPCGNERQASEREWGIGSFLLVLCF